MGLVVLLGRLQKQGYKMEKINRKALAKAMVLSSISLFAVPIIYYLLARKEKKEEKEKEDGKEDQGRSNDQGEGTGSVR